MTNREIIYSSFQANKPSKQVRVVIKTVYDDRVTARRTVG